MKRSVLSDNKTASQNTSREEVETTELKYNTTCSERSTLIFCIFLLFPDRYYISKGAIVDQLGGDLSSTPLHWAIR